MRIMMILMMMMMMMMILVMMILMMMMLLGGGVLHWGTGWHASVDIQELKRTHHVMMRIKIIVTMIKMPR